nr:rod shape-determining protein MreC [Marivivens donghaensis]
MIGVRFVARDNNRDETYGKPLRRLLVTLLVVVLAATFLVWRIDSPRVERMRLAIVDRILPPMEWVMAPVTGLATLVTNFQSYQRLAEQNADLRRELQQMKAWREAALQLEQENAKLLDLNNVELDPKLTYITGIVQADSGSPFRQSVLLNVGQRDGVIDGWAVMDGIGLVGRISGIGRNTSRVLLLTDTSSNVPIIIQPSGQRAVLKGDNSRNPLIEFLEDPDLVRPGDRVISTGDGGVFPSDILVGQVALGSDRRLRVRLSADYERLEFLRVLRSQPHEIISDQGGLLVTDPIIEESEFIGPRMPAQPAVRNDG